MSRSLSISRLAARSIAPVALVALIALTGCEKKAKGLADADSGVIAVDEAKSSGRTPKDFPEAEADVFKPMDGGIALTPDEVKGRNTWMMWTGGNQDFWHWMATHSYGLSDLLYILCDDRANRLEEYGLVNEPGFEKPSQPDEYGLPIDRKKGTTGGLWNPPGVDPKVYGYSSGVLGMRIYKNPDFDAAAQSKWDARRYLTDMEYAQSKDLVRPYRVGMSCAFCHAAFDPLHPPKDRNEPEWNELSTTIGNQWFKVRPIFGPRLQPESFVYELLQSSLPGTVDTSLIATDQINNPNTMNPIWQVKERLRIAVPEKVVGDTLQFPDPLFPVDADGNRFTPHVLADGADSIGILGALARVYINIGEFHQEWIRHHNPLVGLRDQSPVPLAKARANSVYWQASEHRVQNLAKFFLKAATRMPLADAPGGAAHLTDSADVLTRGKAVFAENCMGCHSSKQPDDRAKEPWNRNLDPKYLEWARAEVLKPDFLVDNYLSTDERIPVTQVQTNASRALGDNATRGHVWDSFSSETYKSLPSVGSIGVFDPFTKQPFEYKAPSGGPGYYRVPPLVGIWSTAPFLHNNALGAYSGDPSVDARVAAFSDASDKLLWPEKRDSRFRADGAGATRTWKPDPEHMAVQRTTRDTQLKIAREYLPSLLEGVLGYRSRVILVNPALLPAIIAIAGVLLLALGRQKDKKGLRLGGIGALLGAAALLMVSLFLAGEKEDLVIGPIPKGTPIGLLANVDPKSADKGDLIGLAIDIKRGLKDIKASPADSKEAVRELGQKVGSHLLRDHSKCPDLIVDRGHWYGTDLPDADKRALIAFMKTF